MENIIDYTTKYVLLRYSGRGYFLRKILEYLPHYDKNINNDYLCGISYESPVGGTGSAYLSTRLSRRNKAIIDWDKYQESNKDNIYQMLIGPDESARQLALEILKQHNCVLL